MEKTSERKEGEIFQCLLQMAIHEMLVGIHESQVYLLSKWAVRYLPSW